MPTVQVYIKRHVWTQLSRDARSKGITESRLIREIVEAHYAAKGI